MKEQIRNEVKRLCALAGVPFIEPEFDLRGRVAGQFISYGSDLTRARLRFNLPLAEMNENFVQRTPTHEVAHYVDYFRNGCKVRRLANGNRDMHGKFWKAIMRELGAQDEKRCHSYKGTEKTRTRKYRMFQYQCHAGHSYDLTSIRHNKVVRGTAKYQCRECRSTLHFVQEITE